MDAPEDVTPFYSPDSYSSVRRKSVLFNPDNILGTVRGVEDWWSEGSVVCVGGGLGYWLAVSSVKRGIIQRNYSDPDVQKMKLIECWIKLDEYASWHRLSRAVWRVGQTQLASLITTYEQPPAGVAFINSNVCNAVKSVENWWEYGGLGDTLFIPEQKKREIQQMYSDPEEQKKQLIHYWMSTDPLASWRRLITRLDHMSQSPVADAIRNFAEPLAADSSLTPKNVFHATLSVVYDVLNNCLGVPVSVYHQINANPSYPTEEQRREAMITYYINTIPLASWATVAGGLYWKGENVALEAVKKYLHHITDPTLKLQNLETALEQLPDEEWYNFVWRLNVPRSQRNKIKSQYSTHGERKSALLHIYLTYHPAPSWQHVTDALYRHKSHAVLERVQSMFPTGRYQAKLIYEREMKHGYSETDIMKLLMMGIAGSGKSTALDTIMEENPLTKEDRDSTPIMKRPVKTIVIVVDGKTKWVKKEQDQFTTHLARQMSTEVSPPQENTPSDNPLPLHTSTDIIQSPPIPTTSDSSSHTPTSHPPPHSATSPSTTTQPSTAAELSVDSLLQSPEVDEEFVSLINQATNYPKPLAYERWVFLIDSGGQTEFQDAFSVFLTHASVCVFVFKLSEPLDSYPEIEYYRKGQRIGKCQQSLLTNRDIFEKYMRTIYTFNSKAKVTPKKQAAAIQECSPEPEKPLEKSAEEESSESLPPRILVLGTHRDLKHCCKTETVEQKNKQLEAIIPEKLKEQVIYDENKQLIFEMNGLKPEDVDKKTAAKIRDCIMKECPARREKTPWRWHVFNQKMKSIARRMKRNVLSREECLKIAQSLGLDKESFELALEFFHKLSMIFYYPKILPNVVFVDPQVLLDKVTELVEFTFELQEDKDPDPTAPCLPLGWQQFEKFAQVTEKFLENDRFSSHYHQPVFTRKHLTTLLEKLLVFARLSPDTWFMPCVLKHLKPQEIRQYCVSTSPLVVYFPDGGPQHGVCCSLIAHVLSTANQHPSAWSIRLADNRPACLYRNCIQFQVSDYNGFVMLIDRYTYFEVHVLTSPKKLLELWQLVQCALFSGLESVSITLGYSSKKPSPAILCPIHTETSHPAPVRDGEWTCSSDCNEFGDVALLKNGVPHWHENTQDTDDVGPPAAKKAKYSNIPVEAGTDVVDVAMRTEKQMEMGSSLRDKKSTLADATAAVNNSSSGDNSQPQGELDIDDLFEVQCDLLDVAHKWKGLGKALRLRPSVLNRIEADRPDVNSHLEEVLTEWLQQAYNTDRFGLPSWKLLVAAVAHPAGGNDHALARRIAEKHNVPPPPHQS